MRPRATTQQAGVRGGGGEEGKNIYSLIYIRANRFDYIDKETYTIETQERVFLLLDKLNDGTCIEIIINR